MNKQKSQDQFHSVYAYLKVVTIAGGIAAFSLPLAVQSMIEVSLSKNDNSYTSEVINAEPVMLPETVIFGEPIIKVTDEKTSDLTSAVKDENTIVHTHVTEIVSELDETVAEPAILAETEAISDDQVITAAEPSASVDVFPVGYGSFRIIIQSMNEATFTATLFDALNNEIISENYEVYQGDNTFVLESGSIPQGEYLLRVTDGTVISEKKVRLK